MMKCIINKENAEEEECSINWRSPVFIYDSNGQSSLSGLPYEWSILRVERDACVSVCELEVTSLVIILLQDT